MDERIVVVPKKQEIRASMRNKEGVNVHDQLVRRVWDEQDDILATVPLVQGDPTLEDRLFHQLVDLLVEGMFLELRQRHTSGAIERQDYLAELGELAELCRDAGLLPLSGRGA
ncbi:MAG: hypothetical protein ACT452_09350 [Microthrixaceae bacterium]